jgi:hypothetical protein
LQFEEHSSMVDTSKDKEIKEDFKQLVWFRDQASTDSRTIDKIPRLQTNLPLLRPKFDAIAAIGKSTQVDLQELRRSSALCMANVYMCDIIFNPGAHNGPESVTQGMTFTGTLGLTVADLSPKVRGQHCSSILVVFKCVLFVLFLVGIGIGVSFVSDWSVSCVSGVSK